MPGRDPKPPELRRRRNKAPEPERLVVEGGGLERPPLPGSRKLLAATRTYWAVLWRSPMSAVWVEADVPALVRLTRLQDLASRGETTGAVLSEIRQLEDRFGLSPLARRRLQWELDRAAGGAAGGDAAPADDEDERFLRVVSG